MTHRALVVDDIPYNRELARVALENVGLSVEEAEDGQVALDFLDRDGYDLLVLDLQMPVVDGLTVLNKIRTMPKHEKMLIILLTAFTHHANGYQSDVDYVLSKPIDIQDFAKLIRRLFPPSD